MRNSNKQRFQAGFLHLFVLTDLKLRTEKTKERNKMGKKFLSTLPRGQFYQPFGAKSQFMALCIKEPSHFYQQNCNQLY